MTRNTGWLLLAATAGAVLAAGCGPAKMSGENQQKMMERFRQQQANTPGSRPAMGMPGRPPGAPGGAPGYPGGAPGYPGGGPGGAPYPGGPGGMNGPR